jgi:RHS repeat-associated protein
VFDLGNNTIYFMAEGNQQFTFVLVGSTWELQDDTRFTTATLSPSGSNWKVSFPTGGYYLFNSTGQLTGMVDTYGNPLTLTYTGGQLTSVSEPTGRALYFGYQGNNLQHVWDPNSGGILNPPTYTLSYDAYNNLTSITGPAIMGPEGCGLNYAYGSTPSAGLMSSSTDDNGHEWQYQYDSQSRLQTVISPDLNPQGQAYQIGYAYDTVQEELAPADPQTFARTKLTDTRGKVWEYRFELSNNLWRTIDPLSHQSHTYWNNQQFPLYRSAPFVGPAYFDNTNNRFDRAAFDDLGNMVLSADPLGALAQITWFTPISMPPGANVPATVYPGQGHMGVQGNWPGQYGALGMILCGFGGSATTPQDISSLPTGLSYNLVAGTPFHSDSPFFMDPRVPVANASSPVRSLGNWQASNASVQFTVSSTSASTQLYNLSIYTNQAATATTADNTGTFQYYNVTGRSLAITVSDATGTPQTFSVQNNAASAWITFPIQINQGHAVTVTLSPISPSNDVNVAAVAIDPYDNHQASYMYNAQGDVLTRTLPPNPLNGETTPSTWTWTYNANGTRASYQDANGHTAYFYYEDANLNMTRMVDPNGQTWRLSYDQNSNPLTLQDANGHTWTLTYDEKDRPLTVKDQLNNLSKRSYDGAGNVIQTVDANNKTTNYSFTASNRLSQITDAANGLTQFGWDGSGNLISEASPNDVLNGRQTAFTWDDAERLIQVSLAASSAQPPSFPPYALVGMAYDALDQFVAATSPNGMQSPLTLINLNGAQNWLSNPGMEAADNTQPTLAQRWAWGTGDSVTHLRDTTYAHSGQASLKTILSNTNTEYWVQQPALARSGELLLCTGWVASSSTGSGDTVWMSLGTSQFNGNVTYGNSTTTAAPLSSAGWQQLPLASFQVPGDGQYLRFPVQALQLHAATTHSNVSFWFDDAILYSVSRSVRYDIAGRPISRTTPDGAQTYTVYDRWNRAVQIFDGNGYSVSIMWDSRDRVHQIQDSLGFQTTFGYDHVGNLLSVVDARGNPTQFAYDPMNRLLTITYPDNSTEQFTYDPAGNLKTYVNNRLQSRTFNYDAANRLTSTVYATDGTSVSYTYDNMHHVLTRTDRNSDVSTFGYDYLYRVISVVRTSGSGSPSSPCSQSSTYDADSNRTSFTSSVSGQTTLSWSVPTGGYDQLDRLVQWQDRQSGTVNLDYDVDSNRTSLAFPYGSPAPITTSVFDVMDRVIGMATTNLGANILPLSTSYDLASQRLTLSVGNDHNDYGYDAKGQLVQESLNWFSEAGFAAFQHGTLVGTQTDPSSNTVSILAVNDTLTGPLLQLDRWRLAFSAGSYVGLNITATGGLSFAYPVWPTNTMTNALPPVYETPGNISLAAAAEHRVQLTGSMANFDIQVNFANYQDGIISDVYTDALIGLQVADLPFEQTPNNVASIALTGASYSASVTGQSTQTAPTTDVSGIFRISRMNSTVKAQYWNSATSQWVTLNTSTSFSTGVLYIALYFTAGAGCGTFQNFQVNGSTPNYPSTGTYTSQVYDAGMSRTWNSLSWSGDLSGGGTLSLALMTSNDQVTWTTTGPFNTSPQTLSGVTGRYLKYVATFTPGTGATPTTLKRVDITYAGANPSTATTNSFDGVGNILSRVTMGPGNTTITDIRSNGTGWPSTDNINNLNQVVRQDVTVGNVTTTTSRFTFDLSGNRLTKTTNDTTQTCHWDEDNRLLSYTLAVNNACIFNTGEYNVDVFGPVGNITVSYTWDILGRMLTRTDASGTSQFVWDGWDLVMEFAPDGTSTRYYVVNGLLYMFERTPAGGSSATYLVLTDTIGTVRMVLDSANNVIARFDYADAWGNLAATSFDNVPHGGCMYRYVGAYGVRWDPATGLYYMRQRWYDPAIQRLLTRDLVKHANLYSYASNRPARRVDPLGLAPLVPPGGWSAFWAIVGTGATIGAVGGSAIPGVGTATGAVAGGGLAGVLTLGFWASQWVYTQGFGQPSAGQIAQVLAKISDNNSTIVADQAAQILKQYMADFNRVTTPFCGQSADNLQADLVAAFHGQKNLDFSTKGTTNLGGLHAMNWVVVSINGQAIMSLYAGTQADVQYGDYQPPQATTPPYPGAPGYPGVPTNPIIF